MQLLKMASTCMTMWETVGNGEKAQVMFDLADNVTKKLEREDLNRLKSDEELTRTIFRFKCKQSYGISWCDYHA